MDIEYYPTKQKVQAAMDADDPLLMLVSHDGKLVITANIDDALEHVVLLKLTGRSVMDIDKFFRIVLNREGADWTFVCPSEYKNIMDRSRRISSFYNDGMVVLTRAIKQLGYEPVIDIPSRYRRHSVFCRAIDDEGQFQFG